ncbi:MAG: hypothetical protein RIR00_1476 [Pseudomonadota bacterium]|jgi:AcrR family transcriptional regulator
MTTTPAAPRWQRRAEARPEEVLQAALAAFAERGYAATSLDEVARRAGITKGTLYLYFPNKAELFKAVVRNALVSNLSDARQRAASHSGSSWSLLAGLLREFTHRIVLSPLSAIPKLVIAEAGNFPDIAGFYFNEVVMPARQLLQGILQRGIAQGEFRPLDLDHIWRVVIAPLLLAILWQHSFKPYDPVPLDVERHLASHLDLLRHGLLLPQVSALQEAP